MSITPAMLIGGGIAALAVAGIGYMIYQDVHTGTSTSTLANGMFNSYRRNFDDHLDLKDNNAWLGSETLRTSSYRSGDYIYTDVYSNRALLEAADGLAGQPRDSQVTRPELQALYEKFDTDGNHKLKMSERTPLNEMYGPGGEQLVSHSSYWSPLPRTPPGGTSPGHGGTSPGDGPGNGGGTAPGDGPGGPGGSGGTSGGDGPAPGSGTSGGDGP